MTKDELITKQQLEIEQFKENLKENKSLKKQLHGRMYSIGAPLNDNSLRFNNAQMFWLSRLNTLIQEIN